MAVLEVPAMYLKNHLSSVHDPTIADLNIRERSPPVVQLACLRLDANVLGVFDVEEFSWRLHIHTNAAILAFPLSVWVFHRGHRPHIGQVSSVAGQAPTFDDVYFSRVGPHAVWSMSWNIVTSTLHLDGPHRAPTKFPVRYQPVQITFISYSAIDLLPEPELFSARLC